MRMISSNEDFLAIIRVISALGKQKSFKMIAITDWLAGLIASCDGFMQ